MHEFSICKALLQQLEELAALHAARSVSHVTLQVGPLSGVEPGLLESAFAVARSGSCAADAGLTIECSPLCIRCSDCQTQAEAPPDQLCCPACGGRRTQLISGAELLLRRVEFLTVTQEESAPCASAAVAP
jgi:hydrogenase nickel incorporation protein HypA/HybF